MTEKYRSQQAENWYRSQLEHPEKFPFHFTYRQTEYHGFPSGKLRLISRKTTAEEGKECTELSWALDDGLLLTLFFSFYPAFGVSEWTVWFENTGSRDSGTLEDIKSVLTFCGERPVLKGILGDHVNQYRPYVQELEDMDIRFVSDSGRAPMSISHTLTWNTGTAASCSQSDGQAHGLPIFPPRKDTPAAHYARPTV